MTRMTAWESVIPGMEWRLRNYAWRIKANVLGYPTHGEKTTGYSVHHAGYFVRSFRYLKDAKRYAQDIAKQNTTFGPINVQDLFNGAGR